MRKEKILRALEEEFGKCFLARDENFQLCIYCPLNKHAVVVFEITRDYAVGATVMEDRLVMMTGSLPYIELKTEDQVVQLVKSGYRHLRNEYHEVY